MRIKVASWNIAGGHKVASLDHFDYLPEDISYFTNILKEFSPDVICLQESHTSKDSSNSNAEQFASNLGMKVIINSPNSPSHIDQKYRLSNAILSKFDAESIVEKYYPDPEGELYWSDGRVADTHKKNLQFALFEHFNVANNQMLPIKLFGFSYDDGTRGSELAKGINDVMRQVIETPVIWCGDFNYYDPLRIYPFMNELGLKESLPNVTTRPSKDSGKKKTDHIYYSREFKLIKSDVVTTETDHYLCFSEFEK